MIKYFKLQELVPNHIYNLRGEKAWELLDQRALLTLQWLREQLGECVVNNWHVGGQYSQSGLRTHEFHQQDGITNMKDAKIKMNDSMSQHKYGRAFDCKFKRYTADQAREWIKENWHKSGLPWAITLEEDVSWLHFDVRTQPENKVYTFKP